MMNKEKKKVYIKEMKNFGCEVDVCDPVADKHDVKNEYQIDLYSNTEELPKIFYNAIIIAVAHDEYRSLLATKGKLDQLLKSNGVLIDVKGVASKFFSSSFY